jgi:23S rRNA pseudouridine2605 synthase
MPRDSDKDNASSRGRAGRPPAGKGGFRSGPSSGGKGRSGAARGPDKKFAKRAGAPGRDAGDRPQRDFSDRPKRDFSDRPKRDFSDRPKRDFSDRPKRDFSDRPKRDFSDRPKRDFGDRPSADRPKFDRPKRDFSDRPRRDDGDAARPRFNRDDRPRQDRDGGERSFKPRGDRPQGDRPFKPRGDRPSFQRDGARPAAGSADRKFGDRKPFTPRGDSDRPRGDRPFRPREDRDGGERSFKPRGDRPQSDRPFKPRGDRPSGDRPFKPRDDRPRQDRGGDDRPRQSRPYEKREGGDRPFGGRPASRGAADRGPRKDFGDRPRPPRKDFGDRPQGGERKPWQSRDDRGPRDDRAPRRDDARSSERPRFDRPRDDRGGSERPRFSRPRDDRPRGDWQERPRRDNAWQEHPRSESGSREERPRRDNEDDSKIFAKRPAYGGRGAYRDRDRDERRPERAAPAPKTGERIAKLVSRAGLCSRRDAETWITEGRVSVNGRVITSPALDVTTNDVVTVDGKPLPAPERTRLFLYHKPRGLMTTHADPEGRPTVFENLPEGLPRLISIGRLDFNTEGLLLLTNDGGLARTLELPDTGWLRRYRVRAHGEVTQAQLDALKEGIEVDGVKYGPIDAQLERDQGANVWLVFAIREGKNREVRNVLAHLGLEVNRLIRVSYGPFQLGEIPEGEVEEVKARVLRDQLGDKIARAARVNFSVPQSGDAPPEPAAPKPRAKRSMVEDRKGRRVKVERSGSEESRARNEERAHGGPPKRPKRTYHGKREIAPRD